MYVHLSLNEIIMTCFRLEAAPSPRVSSDVHLLSKCREASFYILQCKENSFFE